MIFLLDILCRYLKNLKIYLIQDTGGICCQKLINKLKIRTQRAQEGTLWTNILCRTCVFCMYIVWCQLTHLHACWRHLWHVYTNSRPLCDMIVNFSEYYLMGNDSLVGFLTLILYNIIDGGYVETVILSCLSLLLILYI